MPRLLRLLTILCLAFAVVSPAAQAAVGQPLTSGPNYDRNPTVVQDGRATYLFFTRSQTACNRLDGCNADNVKYDLWFKKSLDGGDHYGPATFAAANPEPASDYRGRTIAAVNDGTRVLVFWADGGSERTLYKVEKPLGSDAFTPAAPVAGVEPSVFNAEAVSRGGGQTFLYTEGTGAQGYGVYARTFSGQTAGAPVLVSANKNIPKAIVDNRKPGAIRLTYTDGTHIYVNSSANGLTFTGEQVVATAQGSDTYWDPNLAQTRNGFYYLTFAPDRGDGRQQLAVTTSKDFSRWTEPRFITPAEQAGTKYWDYWPEGFTQDKGNDLNLYYTSERGFAGNDVGTGHIWALPGDDHDNGFDFGGSKGWDD